MYSPFQGEAFLQSYRSNRMSALRRSHATAKEDDHIEHPEKTFATHALVALKNHFYSSSFEAGDRFREILNECGTNQTEVYQEKEEVLSRIAMNFDRLAISESIKTLDLLHSLVATQLTATSSINIKIWLDRLVQRFEVTKKLYETYPSGFRKGEGKNTSVQMYWLFALSLCLFYTSSTNIKYLSTLLKVCDLLVSLSAVELDEQIPANGLSMILAVEILSVQLLAEQKGVAFATK